MKSHLKRATAIALIALAGVNVALAWYQSHAKVVQAKPAPALIR